MEEQLQAAGIPFLENGEPPIDDGDPGIPDEDTGVPPLIEPEEPIA